MEKTDSQLRDLIGDDIEEAVKDLVSPGRTIGKYRIAYEIGRGGMGAVYLAEDAGLGNRKIAIKVIKYPSDEAEHRQKIDERFRREAIAAGRVSHPNVITIFAFEEIGGERLQVMEYIDGRTLSDELDAQPKKALPPEQAARLVIELLRGVASMHAAGIIHRDLKPKNVMLAHDGDRVKIIDLGLVKFEGTEDPATDLTLTQCDTPMGSPLYMSPEQTGGLQDAYEIDHRSDIYSIGVTFFQMLCGRVPFDNKGKSVFQKHLFDPVPQIASPFGPLPSGYEAVVRKAMAKDPAQRYQTADEMRAALEALIAPRPQRHGGVAALLAVLALFALIAAGGTVFFLKTGRSTVASRNPAAAKAPSGSGTPARLAPAVPVPTDTAAIKVPPPPAADVVPTSKAGCQAYQDGRTGEAASILTKVVADSPGNVEALYCLCGSYNRLGHGERDVCERFLSRASDGDRRKVEVRLWLRRMK